MDQSRGPVVRRAFIGALVLLFSLLAASCGRPNFEITTATTPVCTADQLGEWDRVVNLTQRVRGQDPAGYYIEEFPAEKYGFPLYNNNWYPLSGYKETLCGTLHHFNVFDGGGDEMDWNNFMIPAPDFQSLITDALPYKGGSGAFCFDDNWHDCAGTDDCLEAELTPDETFWNNPWFPKSTGESVLEGREICTYGPWIRECVHGNRPEIHTSEQYWWKEKWGDDDLYWLLALHDDSDRFDDEGDFDTDGDQSDQWRPWAAAPITAQFQIAFEVNPAGPVLRFEIGEAFAQHIVTKEDADSMLDADNGVQHAISYNGDIVLRANENQPNDTDIGVTFTEVCRLPNDNLRGYVTLTTEVGVNTDGKEGYHVLFVTGGADEVRPPVRFPELTTKAVVLTSAEPDSMKPVDIDGRLQLVGDLKVKIRGDKDADPRDTTIDRMEIVAPTYLREQLVFQPDPERRSGSIKGLRLLESAQLVFVTQGGTRIESTWPGLSVAALIDEKISGDTEAPASAWPALVKAAGGIEASAPQGLRVMRASQAQLTAAIRYAMHKDGRVALEEGSPFVERLSEVVGKADKKGLTDVFGTDQPFKIEWTFEAIDVRTGASVPVATPSAPSVAKGRAAVAVSDAAANYPSQAIQIVFPEDPNGVYEVRATANVTDAFGSTTKTEHRLWSHYLTDGTRASIVKPLLPTVAAAAGIAAEDLMAATSYGVLPLNDPRLRDPKVRRALIVHNFARQAADDKRISVDELTSLISGARLVGSSDERPK